MALWTPYAEDAALDLSKKCKNPSLTPDYYPNNIVYGYPYPVPDPHPYYGYPVDTYVPVPRSSPLSGDSMCSYTTPVSPRTGMMSPPASPTSQHTGQSSGKRSRYMEEDSLSDDPDFQEFEKDTLRAMAEKNGGSLLGNNPRMRRAVQGSAAADDSYRRQRERNNHAAKQSRDRRKLREIHLALKVTFLRNELAKLRGRLAAAAPAPAACVRCHQPYTLHTAD